MRPMANITQLKSRRWRVLIRRKGQCVSRTFPLKSDAEAWAREAERNISLGKAAGTIADSKMRFGALVELHIKDLNEVRKPIGRAKAFTLEKLKQDLGGVTLVGLNRERLIAYGKARAKQGAGPATVSVDIGYIHTVLVHASAIHGIEVPLQDVMLARTALLRLGLIGKAEERDRRPTQDELDRIIAHIDNRPRQTIPVSRVIKFAIATGMRQEEICSLLWHDIDWTARLALVRNRKHPRRKMGNHQKVPLLDATGYDAVALLREQREIGHTSDRVFPYTGFSLSAAFRRACNALQIEDLRFHDLRHEATSRLFEAGFDIPEVSLVTGHKDWKMLRRYLHLQAHHLVGRTPQRRLAFS